MLPHLFRSLLTLTFWFTPTRLNGLGAAFQRPHCSNNITLLRSHVAASTSILWISSANQQAFPFTAQAQWSSSRTRQSTHRDTHALCDSRLCQLLQLAHTLPADEFPFSINTPQLFPSSTSSKTQLMLNSWAIARYKLPDMQKIFSAR